MIKKIAIQNFKTFKKAEMEFGEFNVIIGANASGKTNLFNAFRFIRDIANSGIQNAITLQGGLPYLTNVKIGTKESLSIKIDVGGHTLLIPQSQRELLRIEIKNITYELNLVFKNNTSSWSVIDSIVLQGRFSLTDANYANSNNFAGENNFVMPETIKADLGEGTVSCINTNGKVELLAKLVNGHSILAQPEISGFTIPPQTSVLEALSIPAYPYVAIQSFIKDYLGSLPIYRFFAKQNSSAIGKIELDEDGGNLPIVVNNILEDDREKETLISLVNSVLPFVRDLNVESTFDNTLSLTFKENYTPKAFLPSFLLSEGTVHITALITALYFQRRSVIMMEEPEIYIHPRLIHSIVNLMQDVSRSKQIFITTHSPEIVRLSEIDALFLISRDKNGFSRINKPLDIEDVQTFLNNELGIEELFVQGLLEG